MEELLNTLRVNMSKMKDSISYLERYSINEEDTIDRLNGYLEDLDTIDPGLLFKLMKPEERTSSYRDALDYVGVLKEFKGQSQIDRAIECLTRTISSLIDSQNRIHVDNLNRLDELKKVHEKFETVLPLIENYSASTFIDKDSFNIIYDYISTSLDPSLAIEILKTIGNNNAKLVKKMGKEEVLPLEEEVEVLSENKPSTKEKVVTNLDEYRRQFLELYKNFINNEELVVKLGDLYNKLRFVTNDVEKIVRNMSDDELEVLVMYVNDGEMDGRVSAAILMLEECASLSGSTDADTTKLEGLLNKYLESVPMPPNVYMHLTDNDDIRELIKDASNYVDDSFRGTYTYRNLNALVGQDKNVVDKYLEDSKTSEEDFLKYKLINALGELEIVLNENYMDSGLKNTLLSAKEALVENLNAIKNIEEKKILRENHLYNETSTNSYLVFLNKDAFLSYSDEIVRSGAADYDAIASKLYRFTGQDASSITSKDNACLVNSSKGNSNEESIYCQKKGPISLTFKRVGEITGKPVYMVILPFPQKVGKFIKDADLALNLYDNMQDQVEYIEKQCQRFTNWNHASLGARELLEESEEVYQDLLERQQVLDENKSKKSLVGGHNE